jgi:hypothetical protein
MVVSFNGYENGDNFKKIYPNKLYDNLDKKQIKELIKLNDKRLNDNKLAAKQDNYSNSNNYSNSTRNSNNYSNSTRNSNNYSNNYSNSTRNQQAVKCYSDTACQNKNNGIGCRTIFYTDGICLNENCIPTDDYDAYRDALIDGNREHVQKIEKYAKLYQDYEKTFTPPACALDVTS